MSTPESIRDDAKTFEAIQRNPCKQYEKDREDRAWEEMERDKKVWTKKEADALINEFRHYKALRKWE